MFPVSLSIVISLTISLGMVIVLPLDTPIAGHAKAIPYALDLDCYVIVMATTVAWILCHNFLQAEYRSSPRPYIVLTISTHTRTCAIMSNMWFSLHCPAGSSRDCSHCPAIPPVCQSVFSTDSSHACNSLKINELTRWGFYRCIARGVSSTPSCMLVF